jgi:hypothetical protein
LIAAPFESSCRRRRPDCRDLQVEIDPWSASGLVLPLGTADEGRFQGEDNHIHLPKAKLTYFASPLCLFFCESLHITDEMVLEILACWCADFPIEKTLASKSIQLPDYLAPNFQRMAKQTTQ